MPRRRIAVNLPEELYQKLLRHGNKPAFVREALQACITRIRQCNVPSQM